MKRIRAGEAFKNIDSDVEISPKSSQIANELIKNIPYSPPAPIDDPAVTGQELADEAAIQIAAVLAEREQQDVAVIKSATALAKLRLEERYNSETDTFDEYSPEEFLAELSNLGLVKPKDPANTFIRKRRESVRAKLKEAPQSAPRIAPGKKSRKK